MIHSDTQPLVDGGVLHGLGEAFAGGGLWCEMLASTARKASGWRGWARIQVSGIQGLRPCIFSQPFPF